MRRRHDRRRRQRGAVLLLLLVVLGLGAATMLISAFGKVNLEGERQRRTSLALAQAKDALLGYAVAHGRLPRPASSALDGRESGAPCSSDASCTGLLPWVTLGLDGADAWGKLLRYSVTPAYTRPSADPASLFGSKQVQGRAGDGTLVILAGRGGCERGRCAPVVVWSNGRNNFGTSVAGSALANASETNADEVANDGASDVFIQRQMSEDSGAEGGEYDDIVSWMERGPLLERLRAAAITR